MHYDLNKKVLEFYNNLTDEKNDFHRYRSWEHSYAAFKRFEKEEELTAKEKDILALHPSMYLSSWGMFRGSSFFFEHDYKLQAGLIDVLWQFKHLYNIQLSKMPELVDDIVLLDKEVKDYYEKEGRKYKKNGKELLIRVSNTLSSKIIMGSLGCLPAYDRFFLKGLDQLKISKKYNKEGFLNLYTYFSKGKIEFKEVRNKINECRKVKIDYPDMKIIDMALFQLGMSLKPKEIIKLDDGTDRSLAILEDGSFRILDASQKELKNTKQAIAKVLRNHKREFKDVNTRSLGNQLLKRLKSAA